MNTPTIRIGDEEFPFDDEQVRPLRDSTAITDDPDALRDRLENDGYVFIREFHDPDLVAAARRDVLGHMNEAGVLDPDEPTDRGVVHPEYFDDGFDMTAASWTHYPSLQRLVDGEAVLEFFERFLGDVPLAYDYKWGRAKPTGGFTGFHVDRVFMGRGTDDLYTVWRPVGDCPLEMGPLVVCPGSHRHDRLRETYAQLDVDRDVVEGAFSEDPIDVLRTVGASFATADFAAGDALIFGPYLLHGSLTNQTDRFRISIDTRYQSVSEPVDGRWVGADPIGHYNWPSPNETPMEELREEWGLASPR